MNDSWLVRFSIVKSEQKLAALHLASTGLIVHHQGAGVAVEIVAF
jgi:hypothetical protein